MALHGGTLWLGGGLVLGGGGVLRRRTPGGCSQELGAVARRDVQCRQQTPELTRRRCDTKVATRQYHAHLAAAVP